MKQVPDFYEPKFSLIFYTNGSTAYVEEHKIRKKTNKNQFEFGPAKPCRVNLLSKMLSSIKNIDKTKYQFEDLIPSNVIRFNIENEQLNLIWMNKRCLKKITFDETHHNICNKHLKIIPNLIFQIKNNTLYVYAYKINRGLNTKIYYAPFHNIYNDGKVCMGNAKINWDITNLSMLILHIEKMFFSSKFTHLNHKNFKNNINVIWDKNGFEDQSNLTSYNKFLKDLI